MSLLSEKENQNIRNRLNRLEGQLRGIRRMIDEDRECKDVLQQFTASRSALQATIEAYLAVMIKDCLLADEDTDTEKRRQLADEMLTFIHNI